MSTMKSNAMPNKQRGLVIVMLVLVMVVLLAVAALALDLGRLYVLKSEMQNAVDAAALAAAKELDAKEDAISRATLAAKGLLVHNSHFSKTKELLGSDVGIDVTFYCSIGSSQDMNAVCPGPQDPDDEGKILVTSNSDSDQAHYVKVTLDPEGNEDRYGIELYFIPVLSVIGIDTSKQAVTTVSAVAGRHFYYCNYPPLMLCDPFEGSGGYRNNVDEGDQILLKLQGGPNATWSPGTFGFLDPPDDPGPPPEFHPGGGVTELKPFLANEGNMGCTPPMVMPQTGNMATPMTAAMNTRFDIYSHPPFNKYDAYVDYPPASNIADHSGYYNEAKPNECPPAGYCTDPANITNKVCWRDSALRCPGGEIRIGDGDWSRNGYWQEKYGTNHPDPDATRYETYLREINQNLLSDEDKPELTHRSVASPDRRVINVAVLSCESLGIKPNEVFPVIEPDNGFAKLFITERSPGGSANNFFVEHLGWVSDEDSDYRVIIQLYE